MAEYIKDGTYRATGVAASVYRNDKGNVILQTEWLVADLGKTIKAWDCLVIGNTQELRTKSIDNIRKWAAGWDGTAFAWFPANIASVEAELVIANEPRNPPEYDTEGNLVTQTKVKYINPIGGGGAGMQADESAELDKIFSARLRANAGAMATGGVAKPPAPPAPVPQPPKPAPTKEAIWARFLEKAKEAGITDAERRNKIFFSIVAETGRQTNYDDWKGEDWAALAEAVEKWEDLPF